MFTGIVEGVGRVVRVERARGGLRFAVESALREVAVGDSVAVAGVCQTAVAVRGGTIAFEAVGDTLAKTTLAALRPGARVNLERAATPASFLGGHLVTGHVSGVARLVAVRGEGAARTLEVAVGAEWEPFVIAEGSIALDGASLTVAGRGPGIARISLIPHTAGACTLGSLRAGDMVNVELDYLARQLAALAGALPRPLRGANEGPVLKGGVGLQKDVCPGDGPGITEGALRAWGYL